MVVEGICDFSACSGKIHFNCRCCYNVDSLKVYASAVIGLSIIYKICEFCLLVF